MYRFGLCGEDSYWLSFLREIPGILWCRPAGRMSALLVCPGAADPAIPACSTVITGAPTAIRTKQLITYGMGLKDTLTFSSIDSESCVVALQREIVTLGGKRLERQEFPLPVRYQPEWMLAVSAALLVCGYAEPGRLLAEIPKNVCFAGEAGKKPKKRKHPS